MSRPWRAAVLALLPILLSGGCEKEKGPDDGKGSGKMAPQPEAVLEDKPEHDASPGPSQSAEEKWIELGAKTRGYVKCINRHGQPMADAKKAYFAMFRNRDAGPKGCRVRGVPAATLDPGDCVRNVARSKKRPPALAELDLAGDAYAQTMVAIYENNGKLVAYYESDAHKADACAFGLELHPKMIELWDAFDLASKTLRRQLDNVSDDQERAQLAVIADKVGKSDIRYLHRLVMIESLVVLRLFELEADAAKPDEDAIATKAELVAESINKLTAKVGADRRGSEYNIRGVSNFTKVAVGFRAAVLKFAKTKNRMKRIKLLIDKDSGVLAKYNALVEASNWLKHRPM